MKKILLTSLMTLGLMALTARACNVSGVVACPPPYEWSTAGIEVYVDGIGTNYTTGNGAYLIELPGPGEYIVCVNEKTLPDDAKVVGNNCKKISIDYYGQEFQDLNFTLSSKMHCSTPQQPGPCWLTGGGTVFKVKGTPNFSFGGVVNPGCSPTAAGGGNWNVIDHFKGLHFQGIDIQVVRCWGEPTRSPKVDVNVIDFKGTGIIQGVEGNPLPVTPVTFVAEAWDKAEPGAGKDLLGLIVKDAVTDEVLLSILDPDTNDVTPISTGNLQIHTSSCQMQ